MLNATGSTIYYIIQAGRTGVLQNKIIIDLFAFRIKQPVFWFRLGSEIKSSAHRAVTADGEMNLRLKVNGFSVLKVHICKSEICKFSVLQIFACNFVNSSHIGTGNGTFPIFAIDPVVFVAGFHYTAAELADIVMCVIILAEKASAS